MHTVLRQLRRTALRSGADSVPDAELLEAFLLRREEAAFEALLRRHGPMVLGVCRRVLGNAADADDAFQATFLVLVRKAATLRSRALLSHWLYGVAYRTALKARTMNARRRLRERSAPVRENAVDRSDEELLQQLDAALQRLPEKYRVPVVLCELEGKTRRQAARLLGLAEGTVSWRLAQARKRLARQLGRHAVWAAVAATVVPSSLLAATLRAARHIAAGKALATGAVSVQVITLTEGVLRTMLLNKLKIVAVVALVTTAGIFSWTYAAGAAEPKKPVDASRTNRLALDEVEALRLEVEALRKSLQVTRERVAKLETEVAQWQPRTYDYSHSPATPPVGSTTPSGSTSGTPNRNMTSASTYSTVLGHLWQAQAAQAAAGDAALKPARSLLTEAEEALKQLHQRPDDPKALDTLGRALEALKKAATPKPHEPTMAPSGALKR